MRFARITSEVETENQTLVENMVCEVKAENQNTVILSTESKPASNIEVSKDNVSLFDANPADIDYPTS